MLCLCIWGQFWSIEALEGCHCNNKLRVPIISLVPRALLHFQCFSACNIESIEVAWGRGIM